MEPADELSTLVAQGQDIITGAALWVEEAKKGNEQAKRRDHNRDVLGAVIGGLLAGICLTLLVFAILNYQTLQRLDQNQAGIDKVTQFIDAVCAQTPAPEACP